MAVTMAIKEGGGGSSALPDYAISGKHASQQYVANICGITNVEWGVTGFWSDYKTTSRAAYTCALFTLSYTTGTNFTFTFNSDVHVKYNVNGSETETDVTSGNTLSISPSSDTQFIVLIWEK